MSPSPARPFSARATAWIIVVAAGSFVLGILLTAFAEDLGQPPSVGADIFSYSAIGHRAAAELLRKSGVPVHVRRTGWPGPLGPATPLVIAEPPDPGEPVGGDRPHELTDLLESARGARARVLLVLPKWSGVPYQERPRWIRAAVPRSDAEIRRVLELLGSESGKASVSPGRPEEWDGGCEASWGTARVALSDARFLEPGGALEPVVSCGGRLLVARLPGAGVRPDIFLLSDPDLINNQGLGRRENAEVVRELFLRSLDARSVVWDETLHGFVRVGGFLRELVRFPLALILAQVVLTSALVLWAGAGRFGKPVAPPPVLESGKRQLVDNTAELLSLTGNPVPALPRYFEQTARAVASRYYLPAELPEAELVSRLQAIGTARGVDFDLEGAQRAVRGLSPDPDGEVPEALELAGRLHHWREAMIDVD